MVAKARQLRRYVAATKPRACHPLVAELFDEMAEQRICIRDMVDRSGVHHTTLHRWKNNRQPGIMQLEACFNVLGYTLTAKHK